MSRGALFLFEGEQMTVQQVRAIVPVLGENAIRNGLKSGRDTRVKLLSYNPKAASLAATRKHIKANPLPSYKSMTPHRPLSPRAW